MGRAQKTVGDARAHDVLNALIQSGEQVIATRLGTLPEGGEPWETRLIS